MSRRRAQSLAGRRILITGGSSGIGLVTARQLGQAGARVVLLARGRAGLQQASEQVPACAGVVSADVSDRDSAVRGVEEAASLLGGLDAVVVAAGAAAYGPFAEMSGEDVERTLRITLMGMVNTVQAALPHVERRRGTVVVVGSVAGRLPTPWLTCYAAAKHGVRGFMRSLSLELVAQRRPVRLALIAPGPVDTPFWRRARTPDARLPPKIAGAYSAEAVAAEILRALASPGRLERTVGGLMLPAIALDSLAPNLVLAPLGVLARLGWRARERQPRSDDDALSEPAGSAHAGGGLISRPSLLVRVREVIAGRR